MQLRPPLSLRLLILYTRCVSKGVSGAGAVGEGHCYVIRFLRETGGKTGMELENAYDSTYMPTGRAREERVEVSNISSLMPSEVP